MSPTFEWDPEKARINERKHGVSFEEASFVFGDGVAQFFDDPTHSDDEDRLIIIGMSNRERLLAVSYTYRAEETVRIINARHAELRERRAYEENFRSHR